ncbi:MAG TPA: winged helix-turn-helix domain-containing protein [Roseateles sp.]|uniref:winged helix-turn-helix domain-containing protein n=1 Tax=Roseateles sp. TaxID=1971397 RepID=UPI002ED7A2A3
MRIQLRRRAGEGNDGEPVLSFGDIVVDRTLRQVSREGRRLRLTSIEYRLLQELCGAPGRVLTYQRLPKAVRGPDHVEDLHYVRVRWPACARRSRRIRIGRVG